MTNEITKASDYQQTVNYAKAFKESGMFPDIKSEAMAIVKIQAGTELGIGAFAAMQGVDIIQGKCRQNANLQAALIKRSGKYTYKILEHSDRKCKLEFFEIRGSQWESMGFSEYTIEEAQQAGLASKDIWKKYPKNLLFARTISNGAKWFTPDVFIVGAYNESDEFDYQPVVPVDRTGIEALKAIVIEPEIKPETLIANVVETDSLIELNKATVELKKQFPEAVILEEPEHEPIEPSEEQLEVLLQSISQCKTLTELDDVRGAFKGVYKYNELQKKRLKKAAELIEKQIKELK